MHARRTRTCELRLAASAPRTAKRAPPTSNQSTRDGECCRWLAIAPPRCARDIFDARASRAAQCVARRDWSAPLWRRRERSDQPSSAAQVAWSDVLLVEASPPVAAELRARVAARNPTPRVPRDRVRVVAVNAAVPWPKHKPRSTRAPVTSEGRGVGLPADRGRVTRRRAHTVLLNTPCRPPSYTRHSRTGRALFILNPDRSPDTCTRGCDAMLMAGGAGGDRASETGSVLLL